MILNYFEGQDAFFEDYKKAVKELNFDQQTVIDDVLKQLNSLENVEKDELTYVLEANLTTSGKPMTFPFRKELVANDMEASVSNKFIYTGQPYETDFATEEQL